MAGRRTAMSVRVSVSPAAIRRVAWSERRLAVATLRAFAGEVARLGVPIADRTLEADTTCEPADPVVHA